METPIATDPFVPGGRRFTLITPIPKNGLPANVIMPVLTSGSSYRHIAHLVHMPPPKVELQPNVAMPPERVLAEKNRYVLTPAPASANDRDSSHTLEQEASVKIDHEVEGTLNTDRLEALLRSPRLSSTGPVRREKKRHSSGVYSRRSPSYGNRDISSPHPEFKVNEASPYTQMYSKKLYRSKRVYWYRWTGTTVLDTPPPVPKNLPSVPPRALFVYYRVGYKGPQIWQRDSIGEEGTWKKISPGVKQVINGSKYVLTLTTLGDPSWLATSTAEKKAQKAKKAQIKQESYLSMSSSSSITGKTTSTA